MASQMGLPVYYGKDDSVTTFSRAVRYSVQMIYLCSPFIALIALVVGSGYLPSSSADKLINVADAGTIYTGSCANSVCSWYGECLR